MDCIETVSGKLLNIYHPEAKMICVTDIAWALSRISRFAGHSVSAIPLNVAQHSIYVSELAEHLMKDGSSDILLPDDIHNIVLDFDPDYITDLIVKALFHDGHEFATGDMPSPVKRIPELSKVIKEIEINLDAAIYEVLNLPSPTEDEKKIIKYCDKLAQAIEAYHYMPSRGLNWNLPKPSLIMLQRFPSPLSSIESYQAFLNRYNSLTVP